MSQEPSNGPIPTPTPQQNADGGQPAHFEALDAALVSFISSQNGRLLPSFEQHLHEIERALEKTPMASHFPSMTATLKNMRESAERSKEAALLVASPEFASRSRDAAPAATSPTLSQMLPPARAQGGKNNHQEESKSATPPNGRTSRRSSNLFQPAAPVQKTSSAADEFMAQEYPKLAAEFEAGIRQRLNTFLEGRLASASANNAATPFAAESGLEVATVDASSGAECSV